MRREIELEVTDRDGIQRAADWVAVMCSKGLKAGPVAVRLGRPRRNLEQNSKLWAMLADVANQVDWHGYQLTPEEWKDVFTAGLKKQRAVPGIDGGFVVLGAHTSKMDKETMSNLIDLISAFGAEHGVKWTDAPESGAEV